MAHGLPRSLARAEAAHQVVRVAKYPIDLTVSNIDGATGVAWGTAVLGDVPEGDILIVAAKLNLTLTEASASIGDTFDGDVAVGSAPTADNSLAGAEVDIIPSTAMGAAVSSVNTIRAASTSNESGTILDNTDGSLELNLNVLIDDADISADDQTLAAKGVLYLTYAVMGDD